jgi:TatD DNase family protein
VPWARRVGRLITVGAGGPLASNRAAVALAAGDLDIFAAVAVHPHDAREITDDTWDELRRLWAHPKVVAVG